MRLLRKFTIGRLWLLLPVVGIALRAGGDISDNSFLWHVRAGTLQLSSGEVLRADPFSFTFGGKPWRTQSWLADLGYGTLETVFGDLRWVPLVTGLLAAAALAVVAVVLTRRAAGPLPAAAVLALLMWLGYAAVVPRPVVVSYLLLALVMVALQSPPTLGWALPLLIWLWAGVHGSFAVGLALIGLEMVRSRRYRMLAPHLAASVLAASLTAHGMGVWQTLWQFASASDGLEQLSEWAPPVLFGRANWPLLVIIGLLIVGRARRVVDGRDLIVVVPFVLFALVAQRSVFPGAIVLAAFAVPVLPAGRMGRRRGGELLPGVMAATLVAATVLVLLQPVALDGRRFPVVAAAHLDEGPVFHDDASGGYLIYAYGPQRRVFIDDRAELYGGFLGGMVDAVHGVGWKALFDRYHISQALLRPGQELAGELKSAGWTEVYRDEGFMILHRPDA